MTVVAINLTAEQVLTMGAGSEIDKLLRPFCNKNEYRKPTHGSCCTCQTCGWYHNDCDCLWSPSTEDVDAMEVLDKMRQQRYSYILNHDKHGVICCLFHIDPKTNNSHIKYAGANTRALAISRCTLLTMLRK